MRSLLRYFQNYFAAKNILGDDAILNGLVAADALFTSLVAEKKIPGLAISVLKNGKVYFEKGYGHSDLEQKINVAARTTSFRIASVSKCITGMALGKMVEDGIVHWDDSIYKHVPYFPKKKYDFSLRQLAGHTAGIRGYRGKEFALNQPCSIKESIVIFKNDPLVFEPGTDYLYTSFDFVLLSLAMQEASGISFGAYVAQHILQPLGMVATGPEQHIPDGQSGEEKSIGNALQQSRQGHALYYTKTATGYRKAVEVNNLFKLAGGGYLSTSADIAKLGQAILEHKILSPNTYKELLSSQTAGGTSTYYGLGFQVGKDKKGRTFFGHVGNSVGAYSNFFVYPEQRMVFSILINCTDPKVQDILDEVIAGLLEEADL